MEVKAERCQKRKAGKWEQSVPQAFSRKTPASFHTWKLPWPILCCPIPPCFASCITFPYSLRAHCTLIQVYHLTMGWGQVFYGPPIVNYELSFITLISASRTLGSCHLKVHLGTRLWEHNAGNYNDHLKVPQARTVRFHEHIPSAAAAGVEGRVL